MKIRIYTSVTPEEFAAIKAMARRDMTNVSAYVRRRILGLAQAPEVQEPGEVG